MTQGELQVRIRNELQLSKRVPSPMTARMPAITGSIRPLGSLISATNDRLPNSAELASSVGARIVRRAGNPQAVADASTVKPCAQTRPPPSSASGNHVALRATQAWDEVRSF